MTNQLEEFIKKYSYHFDNAALVYVDDLREFFWDKVLINKNERIFTSDGRTVTEIFGIVFNKEIIDENELKTNPLNKGE